MSGHSYHTRLLVCQSKELSWTHTDTVREVRPLKHIERAVMHHTLLNRGKSLSDLFTESCLALDCSHRQMSVQLL